MYALTLRLPDRPSSQGKLISLGGFFVFQMMWAWTVSLPVTILNSPNSSYARFGGGNVAFGTASVRPVCPPPPTLSPSK